MCQQTLFEKWYKVALNFHQICCLNRICHLLVFADAATRKGVAVIAHFRQFGRIVFPMSLPATTSTTTLTAEIEYGGETRTVNAVTVCAGDYEPPKMVPLSDLEEWLPKEDSFYTGPSKDQVSKGRHSIRMPLMRSEWNRHPRIKRSSAKG